MLHAKTGPSASLDPLKLLDVQLSALIYLLARCANRPCDEASLRLTLDRLETLSQHPDAGALLRQTAARLAGQWNDRLEAGAGPGAPNGGDDAADPPRCRYSYH